jgi:hypothetical protein
MYTRPLGLGGDVPSVGRIGARRPGPLGVTIALRAAHRASEQDDRGPSAAPAAALFTLRSGVYRLRHVGSDQRQRIDEVLLAPDEAALVLEDAIAQHACNDALVSLLRMAATRLAGLGSVGVFVVLRLRQQADRVSPPLQAAAASTPSALRPAASFTVPIAPEDPIPGDVQAEALRKAAVRGVPFCEECARAGARRAGSAAA